MKSAVIAGAILVTLSTTTAAQQVQFDYTGSTVVWDTPANSTYIITVWGASGGRGDGVNIYGDEFHPGRGVGLSGSFTLPQGVALSISVGGVGGSGGFCCNSGSYAGGGGGGSFVAMNGAPLVIAGGGGGEGGVGFFQRVDENGGDASPGLAGGGSTAGPIGFGGGAGGDTPGSGGGGGGFYGDGESIFYGFTPLVGGGGGYPGLAGGIDQLYPGMADGGFGGGGGGGFCGGGGGGGGDCGGVRGGGGGGSFNASIVQHFLGYRYGYGFVLIQSVPEPSGWALMLMGFGLAGTGLRRRRSMRVS